MSGREGDWICNAREFEEEDAEDLFFGEEEADEETKRKMKEAQEEVKNAGMLAVSEPEWKGKLKEKLTGACTEDLKKKITLDAALLDEIVGHVEKAGEATCFVLRRPNSKRDDPKRHRGGNGTGCLVFPKSQYGWLVITNNHVIKDEEEASTAEVIFDFNVDGNIEGTRRFSVSKLVAADPRTENAKDFSKLDFSVLALNCDDDDAEGNEFLAQHALRFDETARLNAASYKTIREFEGLNFRPLIAFSHPRGLAKRLSIGEYPDECVEYPIAHVTHKLPSTRGSSGANLLYPSVKTPQDFTHWEAAFLHYRHGRAVAWQAIGPKLRQDFYSKKT